MAADEESVKLGACAALVTGRRWVSQERSFNRNVRNVLIREPDYVVTEFFIEDRIHFAHVVSGYQLLAVGRKDRAGQGSCRETPPR
jgi:hypothetical protein